MTDRGVRAIVAGWVEDCYRAGGYYEGRMQQCAEEIFRRSPELAALRNSRLLRMNAALRYFLQVISLFVEQGLPLLAAAGGGLGGWRLLQQPPLSAGDSAAAAAAAAAASTTPTDPTANSNLDKIWSDAVVFPFQFPAEAAAAAGSWLGDKVHSILWSTYSLTSEFVTHSLALSEGWQLLQQSFLQATVPLLLAIGSYWTGWLLARFLQNLFVLFHKEQQLLQMQQMFLQEARELIERTLTERMRPLLLQTLHSLLVDDSHAPLFAAYAPTYELLRFTLYDQLLLEFRMIEFSELMAKNRATARYFHGLFYLMRYAEEDIARTLFHFHQEVACVEGDPVSLLVERGQRRLQALLAAAA